MRETSIESYRQLVESGELGRLQQVAWCLLKRYGPCTAQELQLHSEEDKGVWKRLSEMKKKGFVREVGKKKCNVTGRNAVICEAVTATRRKSMRSLERDEVLACALCPNLGEKQVPACGTPAAELMIIGQSPGREEVKQGEPFVGPSGELLDGMLAEIPLGREDCYITNVVKCHPPGNRPSTLREIQTCFAEWLGKEIKDLEPRVVVLLGRQAWSCAPNKTLHKQAQVLRSKKAERSLIFWYHPAWYLRRGNVKGFMKLADAIKKELGR